MIELKDDIFKALHNISHKDVDGSRRPEEVIDTFKKDEKIPNQYHYWNKILTRQNNVLVVDQENCLEMYQLPRRLYLSILPINDPGKYREWESYKDNYNYPCVPEGGKFIEIEASEDLINIAVLIHTPKLRGLSGEVSISSFPKISINREDLMKEINLFKDGIFNALFFAFSDKDAK